MRSEENIKPEDLAILINAAIDCIDAHNKFINRINQEKEHKRVKHMNSIALLDKKLSKYLRAVQAEQDKIERLKKISVRFGIPIPETKKSPEIQKEAIKVINENTGESVQLTESEISELKALSGS